MQRLRNFGSYQEFSEIDYSYPCQKLGIKKTPESAEERKEEKS